MGAWLLLVLLSHAIGPLLEGSPASDLSSVTVAMQRAGGPVGDRTMRIAYRTWRKRGGERDSGDPIIYLHGSPGDSGNFERLGSVLASRGWAGIAPDLPGFGASERWIPDYSVRAHARGVLAMMDALHIERAHLVAWSMGGGVALSMADLAPQRVASITLMGAIASQTGEGTGSYAFEHAKYALGYLAFVVGGELVPIPWHHERSLRHSFIRNFMDTDMRDLERVMRRLEIPTLILHGDNDPLVPAWAAELHHAMIRPSRLVMLDGGHFLPVLRAEESADWIDAFLRDVGQASFRRGEVWRAPSTVRSGLWGATLDLLERTRRVHWAIQAIAVLLLARLTRSGTIALAGVLRAVDGVTLAASLVGLLGERALFARGGPLRVIAGALGTFLLLLVAWAMGEGLVAQAPRVGMAGIVGGLALATGAIHALRLGWTWSGRRRFLAGVQRCLHHEFWHPVVFYLPLVPWLVLLSVRHRGALVFTCANPGIANGGGVAGESKLEILRGLGDDPCVLHAELVPAGPAAEERAAVVRQIMACDPRLGSYPVVLKPLAGERGYGLRIARSDADVLGYLRTMTRDVIVQAFHPGPVEVGVLWARDPRSMDRGRIVSVTRKEFPRVVGDGRRTLVELILAHPRYRSQERLFRARMGDRVHEVPSEGEVVSLGGIGNHAQGAAFFDAPELISDALSARIEGLALGFRGEGGGEIDYGRFDVRAPSLEAVREGRDLGIVEVNGTLAESTNLYDPRRSLLFAWRVLFAQWALVYRLGAIRRSRGVRPLAIRRLVCLLVAHHGDRPDGGLGA